MTTLFLPAHTHCSDCGSYSGYNVVGPAFLNREEANQYLLTHKNPSTGWGAGESIVEISAELTPLLRRVYLAGTENMPY